MLSHAAMLSARGVSLVSAGIQPSSFWRLNVRSRSASQPSSNWPLYLSAHSLKIWCGPCAAPGAQYIKNGLSGAYARCLRIQVIALSAKSSLRWYLSSWGGSIGLKFSTSRGSHCEVSPARKP